VSEKEGRGNWRGGGKYEKGRKKGGGMDGESRDGCRKGLKEFRSGKRKARDVVG